MNGPFLEVRKRWVTWEELKWCSSKSIMMSSWGSYINGLNWTSRNGPSFGSLFHVESRLFLEVQFHQVMWFFSKCKNSLNDENFRKTFHVGVFHVFFKMKSWEFSWDFSSKTFHDFSFEGFQDFWILWMDLWSLRWWICIKRTVGFDPGPEWTLAIGLTHASWTHARIWKIHRDFF